MFSRLAQRLQVLPKKKILAGIILFLLMWPIVYSFLLAPRIAAYRYKNPAETSFMQYRMRQAAAYQQPFTASYTFVPLKEISPSLVRAVLYAEDSKFYQHHGIDWETMLSSIKEDFKRKHIVWGGSTITMQLCKNMFLSPRKTLFRKYTEIALALRMERALPKWRILELYLNLIEWGPGIFGAENAAHYYFNKSACHLDDVESSFLAAIIMSPRSYKFDRPNPFFEQRQQWIYSFMVTGKESEPSANIVYEENLEPDVSADTDMTPASANSGIVVTGNIPGTTVVPSANKTPARPSAATPQKLHRDNSSPTVNISAGTTQSTTLRVSANILL